MSCDECLRVDLYSIYLFFFYLLVTKNMKYAYMLQDGNAFAI